MSANLSFPTVPTARQIGVPWGGVNKSLYPASIGHRHTGYDLIGPTRCAIYAVASGVVTHAGYEKAHGYGRHIEISHDVDGVIFRTGYAHLRRVDVKAGQMVTAGEQVGTQGGDLWDALRGASLGAHLHFEVILPEAPSDRDYIETYRGFVVEPLRWLTETFLPKSKFKGRVISKDGVKMRLYPEVSKRAARVGGLPYNAERGFAEELRVGDDIWLRLNSVRTVWVAARYESEPLVDYAPVSVGGEIGSVDVSVQIAFLERLIADIDEHLKDTHAFLDRQAKWVDERRQELEL